jgi:hypothetical protein
MRVTRNAAIILSKKSANAVDQKSANFNTGFGQSWGSLACAHSFSSVLVRSIYFKEFPIWLSKLLFWA